MGTTAASVLAGIIALASLIYLRSGRGMLMILTWAFGILIASMTGVVGGDNEERVSSAQVFLNLRRNYRIRWRPKTPPARTYPPGATCTNRNARSVMATTEAGRLRPVAGCIHLPSIFAVPRLRTRRMGRCSTSSGMAYETPPCPAGKCRIKTPGGWSFSFAICRRLPH